MQYGLGIDLGTTHTAAAVRADGRVEVVRLGGRRAEIPSLVFVTSDGGLLIGDAAERRGAAEPARLAREFKRRMGDPVPILVGGTPFSAHALTAKLLRHVLDTVTQLQDGPPAAITVTHPANWGPYKREQLDQAIKLADAAPVVFRSEPEAAALQHATARRIAPGETVAVYDLGGGTFDVAVLRRDGDGFVVLGEPEGVEQLGGIDFDEAVFGHVLEVLGDKAHLDPSDPEAVSALARLRRDCVEAKEALSFDTETMIPIALPGLHTRVRLNRSELESMIAPSLDDTVAATQRALRSAGVTPDQISAFLLAGGSSRIPLVSQLLSTEFQRPVVADPHPEHSIAMGAAVATSVVIGGASPFSAAVPPPRPAEPSTGGYSATSSPQRAGAAAAAGAGVPGAGVPGAGVPGAGGQGAGSPGAGGWSAVQAPVSGGNAAVSGPPYGGGQPPVSSGAPVGGGAPVNGGPGVSGGAGGGVSYSRGSAAIPGAAPASGGAPTAVGSGAPVGLAQTSVAGALPVSGGGAPGVPQESRPWPPPPLTGTPKRNLSKILMVAALVVAVIAGGTTAGLILLNNKSDDDKGTGAAPVATTAAVTSAPTTQAAADPLAPPTDAMLIRVDNPQPGSDERNSKIYSFKPGEDARTPLPNSKVGDALPKWSHDRKQIAITHVNGEHVSIDIMNVDGSGRHEVADDAGGRVAWSADDKKIAFIKEFDGIKQIAVLNLETNELKQLTRSTLEKDDAMWSPDGKSILYWLNKGGVRQVYELTVANPKEPGRQITKASLGQTNDPVYSPQGDQVLFTLAKNGTSDIWLVGIDGSNPRRVTSNPAIEMDPTFSPDGKWFGFVRLDGDRPTVVVQRVDGTGEKVLTKAGAREAHPCWF
jgi:actin-like ATPase involved in cell morphogenesis